jgi:uncharacterized protein (DUF1810 family)
MKRPRRDPSDEQQTRRIERADVAPARPYARRPFSKRRSEILSDPYNLERFVAAQKDVYRVVCEELRSGVKRSHWMWFIFPQVASLGHSAMARKFAIACRAEAVAYLRHPLLGPRLKECTSLVLAVANRSITEIFGSPDDRKFCSSMTLFAQAAGDEAIFAKAIEKYCSGRFDPATLDILRAKPAGQG